MLIAEFSCSVLLLSPYQQKLASAQTTVYSPFHFVKPHFSNSCKLLLAVRCQHLSLYKPFLYGWALELLMFSLHSKSYHSVTDGLKSAVSMQIFAGLNKPIHIHLMKM